MNKRIPIFICLIVFALGGYYYFFNQRQEPPVSINQEEPSEEPQKEVIGQCSVAASKNRVAIDGILQKMENGFIYVQLKDEKGSIQAIKLTKETNFLEMVLSLETSKLIGFKSINLSDLKEGDQVSILISADEVGLEEQTALIARRITVK